MQERTLCLANVPEALANPLLLFWLQALKQLDAAHQAVAATHGTKPDTAHSDKSVFLQDVLLRRLADEEAGVVSTVLSLPSLLELPGSTLYSALAAVMDTYSQVVGDHSRKSEHKPWRTVARKVRSFLASVHYCFRMVSATFLACCYASMLYGSDNSIKEVCNSIQECRLVLANVCTASPVGISSVFAGVLA